MILDRWTDARARKQTRHGFDVSSCDSVPRLSSPFLSSMSSIPVIDLPISDMVDDRMPITGNILQSNRVDKAQRFVVEEQFELTRE